MGLGKPPSRLCAFAPFENERNRPVNKNDLIAKVAAGADLSKSDASNAVDAIFGSIEGALKGGDEVRIVGFGTFSVSHRAASQGRNPRTGERINIAASRNPKFKPGKQLKEAVNY
jgi:DNA-binding protein HU-beta